MDIESSPEASSSRLPPCLDKVRVSEYSNLPITYGDSCFPGPPEDGGFIREGVESFPSVLAADTDTTDEPRECPFFLALLAGFFATGVWLSGAGPGKLYDRIRTNS